MKYALADASLEVLAQFAWSRVLIGFDFDGTLAPIVPDRDQARMRVRTRQLLGMVCRRYPCAVISGRSRADVLRRLGGAVPRYVVGNHGMEPGSSSGAFVDLMAMARSRLESALAGSPGIEFENKVYSLSIHYRRARRKRDARSRIEQAIARLPVAMRTIHGKSVVNLLPEGAPHKGDALVGLRARAGADTALFVGDDLTDEDVFALDQPGRLLTIRIGASRSSRAAFFLRHQGEIDDLLHLLAHFPTKGASR